MSIYYAVGANYMHGFSVTYAVFSSMISLLFKEKKFYASSGSIQWPRYHTGVLRDSRRYPKRMIFLGIVVSEIIFASFVGQEKRNA